MFGLCVSVHLSVCTKFSATTPSKSAKERYQKFQRCTGLDFKFGEFRKITVFKRYVCKLARAQICLLYVPWKHHKSQRMVIIDSRMLSSCNVACDRLSMSWHNQFYYTQQYFTKFD